MRLGDLLVELRQRDITLWAEGEQLRLRAPAGAITRALKQTLTEQKPALLRLLQQDQLKDSPTLLQMEADSQPDPDLRPLGDATPTASARAALLTGATGFLGAYLLTDLLQTTSAHIYCLVRASTAQQGFQRLQDHLSSLGLWADCKAIFAERVTIVPGDLAAPHLGLDAEHWAALAQTVDVIYHCGASVRWFATYHTLRAANVLSVHTLLKLACASKLKSLHFVSTFAVAISRFGGPSALETELPPAASVVPIGYAQSKWAAEKLLNQAALLGVPVTIHRSLFIGGHSATGALTLDASFLAKMVKGCVQLQAAPLLDISINIAPVDFCSRAILALAAQPAALGQTFHILNPAPTPWQAICAALQQAGYPLRLMPVSEWRDALTRQAVSESANALFPFLPMFTETLPDSSDSLAEMLMRNNRVSAEQTLQALEHTSLRCPAIDNTLLRTYFDYFIRQGFLPLPR